MDAGSKILFYLLVRAAKPDCVCEIGAMDARHARIFRSLRKSALVVAFEPNPYAFEMIRSDPEVRSAGVEVVPRAVSAHARTLTLHVPPGDPYRLALSQASSTRLRADGMLDGGPTIEVEAVRIDEYLRATPSIRDVALWIRAEGGSYDVLESMTGAVDLVSFVLVQVEQRARWSGQKIESDTVKLLEALGYRDVTVRRSNADQRDLVFVRADTLRRHRARIALVRAAATAAATAQPRRADGLAARAWKRAARLVRTAPRTGPGAASVRG